VRFTTEGVSVVTTGRLGKDPSFGVARLSALSSAARQLPRVLVLGAAAVGAGFYLAFFGRMIAAGEVFHRLGFDWTMFWAQAMVLRAGGGQSIYDLEAMNPYLRQLSAYYRIHVGANLAQPVAYPPWFAALVEPFTLLPPPLALALWYGVSIVALVFLAYRVHQFLPRLGLPVTLLLMIAAIPVATTLYMGQVGLLLAVAVGEMLVSFKAGREFRAGLWLAVLLIKPQYAVVYALLILWKMRHRAIAGAIVGTLSFALIGALFAGVDAFTQFPGALRSMADFQGDIGGPWLMINWRAIVLSLSPHIADQSGIAFVSVLSVLTIAVSLLPWRGKWNPDAPGFASCFCLLTLGGLISSYHSHLHGAVLLTVPLAAALAEPTFQLLTRLSVAVALYVPTLMLIWTAGVLRRMAVASNTDVEVWYVWPGALPAWLFLLAFALMSLNLLGVRIPGLQLSARWSTYIRAHQTTLILSGVACTVVVGALLTGVVVPRLRAREALPNVYSSRNLTLAAVVHGLSGPTYVVGAPDGTNRLFIVERTGVVRVADENGSLSATPFLDMTEQVASSNEGGLLGLAFHPQFARNGYVYVSYTAPDWSLQVVRYTVPPDHADSAALSSAHTVLIVPKQSLYDNGGMLAFGPDGYLYVGVGDDQISESAQDLGSLTGKILRLDVDHGDAYAVPPSNPFADRNNARGEVWAYGLRNPAQFSFDRTTGDLWIGDVHHVDEGPDRGSQWESVEFQAADSPGGENFGAPAHFFHCSNVADCAPPGVTLPVAQYDHNMNCSVAGGYVYRGRLVPDLAGAYIFGDYCTGGVFALRGGADQSRSPRLELGYQPIKISSFGEDAAGDLYVVDGQNGTVYRVTGGSLPAD
jgi:glucose/arabinose dehydrogenase